MKKCFILSLFTIFKEFFEHFSYQPASFTSLDTTSKTTSIILKSRCIPPEKEAKDENFQIVASFLHIDTPEILTAALGNLSLSNYTKPIVFSCSRSGYELQSRGVMNSVFSNFVCFVVGNNWWGKTIFGGTINC